MISHHPCGRRQHARCEIGNSGHAGVAERRNVDRLRGRHPCHEQREQQRAEREHGAERRRTQHLQRIPGGGFLAGLAAAAQFIKTERGERADQGKARGQRKQQRQHRIAEHGARQHQSEHRIDHAEDDGVARHRLEILPAKPQRLVQIGKPDVSDDGSSRLILCGLSHWTDIAGIWCGHGRYLPCRSGRISRPFERAGGRLAETIAIRPDAKTGNPDRPCRELNHQRTPNSRGRRSRFGDCWIGKFRGEG